MSNPNAESLQKFYESVKMRAAGIDNAEGKQKIIIELYDKFFKTAFPKLVEKLGIVYTPVEVVDFIIHSVNDVLKDEFGRSISDENIHILDPFTGTGTFITVTSQNFTMQSVWLSSTNSSSTLIEATDIATSAGSYNFGRSKFLNLINVQYRNIAGNVMDVKGFDLVDFNNTTFFYISSPTFGCRFQDVSKLEISSCEFIRWFSESSLPTPSGFATCPMIELQANGNLNAGFGAININGCIIHPQQTQDALNISTSSTTGFGTVVANAFVTVGLTTGVILAGSTYNDTSMLKYDVASNQGLQDSRAFIFAYQTGTDAQGATTTYTDLSIATINSGTDQRFSIIGGSSLRYIGSKPLEILFNVNLTVGGVGGNNESFDFTVTKNGTQVTGVEGSIELDSGEVGPVALSGLVSLVQNDEIWVQYKSPSNDNFTLENFSIVIKE